MVKPAYSRGKYAKKGATASKSKRSASVDLSPTGATSKYGARRRKSGVNPMIFVTGGVIFIAVVFGILVAMKSKPKAKQAIQHVKEMPPKSTLVSAAIDAVRSNVSGGASFASASDPTFEVSDLGGSEYAVTGYVTASGDYKSFEVHLKKGSSGLNPTHVQVGDDVYIRRGQRAIFK